MEWRTIEPGDGELVAVAARVLTWGSAMMEAIARNRHGSSRDFVSGLCDALVAFRGSDSFDDDVCIICVDIGGGA